MAVINKVSLPSGDSFDVSTLSIPFGQVDDTSTETVFTATIPGITALYDGVCVYLKNGVVTSASGWTLNINGLGAKPVYQSMAAASRTTTIFNVAYTGLFVYNSSRVEGGCWDYFYGYNSDTNTTAYQIRGNQATLKMYAALTRYKICFSRFDGTLLPSTATSNSTGTSKTLTTESFDPHGLIYYYNTTTGVAAGESPDVSYMWIHYPTADLQYCFNTGTTLVAKEPVYVQCSPQTDGSFKLSGNDCIVQELPSTDDGYAYIYLGKAYDTYRMSLDLHHPIYCYKNGAIVQWGSGSGSTPDWDENDSASDAYIANRTHYRTSVGAMSNLHPLIHGNDHWGEGSFTGESGNTYGFADIWYFNFDDDYDSLMSDFPDGSITLLDLENPEITVIADGTELELTYIKKPITDSEYSVYVFYNNDFEISYTDNTDGYVPSEFTIASNTEHESIEIKLKMSTEIYEYHTLDDRYLNGYLIKKGTGFNSEIFNGIASYETYQIYISGDANVLEYTFATPGQMLPERLSYCASAIKVEGHDDVEVVNIEFDSDHNHYGITFNKTFDAELPVEDYPITIIVPSKIASGNGSHLEGKARYALGEASHAEGDGTTASGDSSHAEGANTTASGNYSHAEGDGTTASGDSSHAEGANTTASGNYSHAEGHGTTASGDSSHAEGANTTASGNYSHAEGYSSTAYGYISHAEGNGTTASGNYSHAEGANTTAQRRSQHVFGEYNVLDTTGSLVSSKGSYIEIVGKGTSNTNRSNARTLDWSGNEVLAGKLTVGAAPTNNMDVTTKQYVDNSISTAITNINSFNTAIVQALPTTDIDTHTIYFISNSGSGTNVYDEYIYINNNWEKIGSTSIDLSNYLSKDNTTSYTPTGDYNPATKKYVDDAMDDTYIVNFSFSEPSDVIVSDKYRDEVVLAKINEKKIIGYLDNIPYNYCGDYFYATALIDNTYPTIMFLVWDDGIPETVNTLTLHEYDVDAQAYITNVLTKTNTTSYTPTGDYNPATKKYVDDKSIMVVEISQTYENGNAVYSSNKTFAEIAAHINNGGDIICVPLFHSEREFYTIANVTQTTIEFNNTILRYNDNTNKTLYSCESIIISNDNTVSTNGGIGGSLVEKSTTTPLAPGAASIGTEYAYASGDHVHPSELFVVNITSTTTEGVTTYSADKTFAQITAAVEAGKQVTAINNKYVYYYTWKNNSDIIFNSQTIWVSNPDNPYISFRVFRLHSDESILYYIKPLQNKLTFDSTPTENSTNPVTSGGVYTALANASITDEKLSTNTIGSSVYYPIVGTNTASATTKYIDSTGFKYDATSSTNGYARLYLGNGTASGTEGSKYGRLMIYGTTAYGVTLDSGSPTENRTISLPNKNGTIALTSDVPTKVSDLTNDSGFISSYTETDPVFSASAASGITSSDITNWNGKTSLTLGTTSSNAFRGDYGQSAYTHAVTNKGSAFSSGLYKITTNSEGHVTVATSVEKSDITDLGIPAQDTTYTFDGTYNSSTNKAATVSTVTNAVSSKANSSDVLTKTNTTSYTPIADYHPATKKYVDDAVSGGYIGSVTISGTTATFSGVSTYNVRDAFENKQNICFLFGPATSTLNAREIYYLVGYDSDRGEGTISLRFVNVNQNVIKTINTGTLYLSDSTTFTGVLTTKTLLTLDDLPIYNGGVSS